MQAKQSKNKNKKKVHSLLVSRETFSHFLESRALVCSVLASEDKIPSAQMYPPPFPKLILLGMTPHGYRIFLWSFLGLFSRQWQLPPICPSPGYWLPGEERDCKESLDAPHPLFIIHRNIGVLLTPFNPKCKAQKRIRYCEESSLHSSQPQYRE